MFTNDGRYFFAQKVLYGDYMIISSGKNDFVSNSFDKYRWSANTYETPDEIFEYLDSLKLENKKVKSVSAIGAMLYYALGDLSKRALDTLMDAGLIVSYDGFEDTAVFSDGSKKTIEECNPLLDNVSIKRNVTLYEPLIISFEDDTTLELLPCASKGLRIGYCTIPHVITDGVNHCEFDIGVLFNEYISGETLFLSDIVSTTRNFNFHGSREGKSISYNIYMFRNSNGVLQIQENQCNQYEVSFTHAEKIKCSALTGFMPHPLNDSIILEARRGGGAVNIYPVVGTGWEENMIDRPCPEIISVCNFPRLVEPLMRSYFDPTLPINQKCSEGHYDFYYWNFYTKESILRMMDEVEQQILLIRTLPFSEQYAKLCFRTSDFSDDELKEMLEAELDYAQRFCIRLKGMALNTPDYNFISFDGP